MHPTFCSFPDKPCILHLFLSLFIDWYHFSLFFISILLTPQVRDRFDFPANEWYIFYQRYICYKLFLMNDKHKAQFDKTSNTFKKMRCNISHQNLYMWSSSTSYVLNFFRKVKIQLHFQVSLKWRRQLKSFPMEDKDLFILRTQYYGHWWPGDGRSWGVSNYGFDLTDDKSTLVQVQVPLGNKPLPEPMLTQIHVDIQFH